MKILPLELQKDINGYLFHAFPYSILYSFPEYKDYLMENYIQCFGYVDEDFNHMAFGYSDGICYNDMFYDSGPMDIDFHSYEVGLQLDIKKYIMSSINNGKYVVIFVDEYYVEGRSAYKNYHLLHDILIFGYNKESFIYLAFDNNQKLSFLSFPLNQIEDAYKLGYSMFLNLPVENKSKWVNERSIIVLNLKPIQHKYEFIAERFVGKLKLYLNGEFSASYNSFIIPKKKCYIGLHNTNIIVHCLNNSSKSIFVTYPAIHAWYESKKNLLNKIRYAYEKMSLINNRLILAYENEIEQQANIIRLIFIKYQQNGKLDNDKFISILKAIINSESKIINNICNELTNILQ